mmetsp:Transcript_11173/g.21030  ORF Transcript_11173/g.21030 Transcript_11173/m.21030 type:complete len:415 (-) Transcript_11173:951-2195(-)|eukprot:CAMPEP_0201661868 /NCGR_PEP_ID=MMETSP0494-20130426/4112_1 /ASSEMBLY_ACC=CAM_ASM_000839 /TAXON_ID=420259 /ORGANISM="Thalassiosira gravida, Strain GMp14c1" /LENGTH=414 /DNA_ID=CAMNT_0048140089 /DNA_START=345 /DNA_END=1589 /DNA_ORIENTATION=-
MNLQSKSLIQLLAIMLLQTAVQPLKVAVLGSGISGASAARTLAERGIQVTVFEAGRGIGGRTSTRITRDDDNGRRYQFDHGAQYISKPKSEEFGNALEDWKRDGWVKEWNGNFGSLAVVSDDDDDDDTAFSVKLEVESKKKERWVGYPGMHSICRNLLHHKNIRVRLQTRADAIYNNNDSDEEENSSRWDLRNGKDKKRQNHLGSFDWLIATDRNSGAHFRKDLSSANVDEFRNGVRDIRSIKSLTAMVTFDEPLKLLRNIDGMEFVDPKGSSSLGWAARDTSKPGRERTDGRECWVLQSHPAAANTVLRGVKGIKNIREKARDVLVSDFLERVVPALSGDRENEEAVVVHAVGHRWGAAFPLPSDEYAEMDSQLIRDRRFVACGDYFGPLSGRVEGAYLSGISAAEKLCREIE